MPTTPTPDIDQILDALLTGGPIEPAIRALERGGARLALQLLTFGLRRFRRGVAAERRRIARAVTATPRRKATLRRLADRIAVGAFAGSEFGERRVRCIDCNAALPAIAPVDGRCAGCKPARGA